MISLKPLESPESQVNGMTVLQGKHFSIIDSSDIRTIVYEVYLVVDKEESISFYTLERLEENEEILNNSFIKRTFYVDDVLEDGNQLFVFSCSTKAEFVSVNQGILIGDSVTITKHLKFPTFELFPEKKAIFGCWMTINLIAINSKEINCLK